MSGLASAVSQSASAARRSPSLAASFSVNRPVSASTASTAPGFASLPGLVTSPRLRMWIGRGVAVGLKLPSGAKRLVPQYTFAGGGRAFNSRSSRCSHTHRRRAAF